MRKTPIVTIVAALLIIGVVAGWLLVRFTGGEELVIATSTDYPPFSYLDDRGNPAGLDYEYGKLLCEKLRAECRWQTAPFETVLERTAQGDFDLVVNSFTRTEYREELVHFSDPYYLSYGQFTRRAGSDADPDSPAVAAVQAATIYHRFLQMPGFDHLTVETYPSQEEAFRAVSDGRADLTIADDVLVDLAVNQSSYFVDGELGAFERVGSPIVPLPGTPEFDALGTGEIGIVVPKSNAHLLPEINRAIREINAGEEIARVSQGYFGRNILARPDSP